MQIIGPDRFSYFDDYWIDTIKQTDKLSINIKIKKYIHLSHALVEKPQ